ncbi:MAG: glycosyltransferase [Thermoplasmata archaeon]|nr:glycosyltransferase [Thermoplasmata archaeon]
MQNKTLLIVAPFPSENGESILCSFVRNQVNDLRKYFARVIVISPVLYVPEFLRNVKAIPEVHRNNLLFRDYKYENVTVFFPRYVKWPFIDYRYRVLMKVIEKNNIGFDLIHAHFTYPYGYLAVKLKEKFGKKVALTVHENRDWLLKELAADNKKYIGAWTKADVIIRVNRLDVDAIRKYNDNTISLPAGGGFSNRDFYLRPKDECRKQLKLPDKKIILHAGNYKIEHKNQLNLVRALAELHRSRDDFVAYLIGRGAEGQRAIENEVKAQGASDYIKVVGGVPYSPVNELPIWMNAADLFVLPSYSEGNPAVMFEALACGTPFVGTNVGGVGEVITSEEYGILYDKPDDVMKLRELMYTALDRKWNRDKISGYALNFTGEKIAERIIKEYEKICRR